MTGQDVFEIYHKYLMRKNTLTIALTQKGKVLHTVIYADVLFCVNMIIDYIMLVTVKRLLSADAGKLRLLLGAALGGFFSFVVLLPPMPFMLSASVSIAQAFAVCAAAFAPQGMKKYIRASLLLFAVSFIYCGFMTAVLMLFSPDELTVRNGSVYIGISPLLLIFLTLVCYCLMRLIGRLTGGFRPQRQKCRVTVSSGGLTVSSVGLADTGNCLREPFSGECVIVGSRELFKELPEVKEAQIQSGGMLVGKGIRLVPYTTVQGSGVLPAFRPESIVLSFDGRSFGVSAYIALSSRESFTEDCGMIVPAELIMKGS